jgi:hypothetical protein
LRVYCKLKIYGNGNGNISCAALLPVNLSSLLGIAQCHDLCALPEQRSLLDGHHYVTVPVMTTVVIIILVGSVIGGVVITRLKGDQRENRRNYSYLKQEFAIMKEAVQNRESRQEEESRPRKQTAPQPPSYRQPVPPPYAAPGRGRPGYRTSSPVGRLGYSLGKSPSLVTDLQANEESTTGHLLGMHRDQAAAMLEGFQMGRDQVPVNNFPRAAPKAIDMTTMMARQ